MINPEQFEYMLKNEIDLNTVLKDYNVGYKSDSSRQNQEKKDKADNNDEVCYKQMSLFD